MRKTLDCTGLQCPLPVAKTSMALRRLEPGDELEVVCTDPGSLSDIPTLAEDLGHTLVSAADEGDRQVFVIRVAG